MQSAVAQIRQYKTGKFYRDEYRGDRSWNGNEHNVLLRNEGFDDSGSLRFADVAMAQGADDVKDARGMAVADFDNDGDLDIVVNNNVGDCGQASVPPVLLRNDVGQRRNWLVLQLEGTSSNRDALGAVVRIEAGDYRAMRHVCAGSGYASQSDMRLYFGLGDKQRIDALRVQWPAGASQTFHNIDANAAFRIVEGGQPERWDMRRDREQAP